jgi:hypothetical protein
VKGADRSDARCWGRPRDRDRTEDATGDLKIVFAGALGCQGLAGAADTLGQAQQGMLQRAGDPASRRGVVTRHITLHITFD